MEQQIIANGGLQYVPQIAVQYVYLDFDGELTSYNGEILTVDNVEVKNSALTQERIANILAELNAKYAAQNVIFVTQRPGTAEYSTIYIGKTEAFSPYGNFAGLAETIDKGNQIKNDNAFVMLDSTDSNEAIISTIAHETDHLLGTLVHGGEGIEAYACHYYYNNTYTGVLSSRLTIWHSPVNYFNSRGCGCGYSCYCYDKATNVTIVSGGGLNVDTGATATNITLNAGGWLYIGRDATVTGVICSGGAIANYASMTIGDSAVFSGNSTEDSGGAIYNHGSMTIGDSAVFSGNVASGYCGGAIHNGGNMTLGDNAVFSGNVASACGGAIAKYSGGAIANHGIMTIGDSAVFAGNVANNGGAIYTYISGSMTIGDSAVFAGNSAYARGGAIGHSIRGSMTIGDSAVFAGNVANSGGAIVNGGSMTIGDSAVFSGNVASGYCGGAIHNGGNMTLGDNAVFSGNVASGSYGGSYGGGAIFNNGGSMTIGDHAIFSGNVACNGGAIFNNYGGSMTIGDSAVFSGNSAKDGGAIFNNCRVIYNSATNSYGLSRGQITLGDVKFATYTDTIYNTGDIILNGNVSFAGNITIAEYTNYYYGTSVGALQNNGNIDFNISVRVENDGLLLNDWSRVSGDGTYSITVDDKQVSGEYQLIGNAANFNKTITVRNEDGSKKGELSLDMEEPLELRNMSLMLKLDEETNIISVIVDSEYSESTDREKQETQIALPEDAFAGMSYNDYTIKQAPDWLTIDPSTGKFSGTTGKITDTATGYGTTEVIITATKGEDTKEHTIDVVVVPENIEGDGAIKDSPNANMTDLIADAVSRRDQHSSEPSLLAWMPFPQDKKLDWNYCGLDITLSGAAYGITVTDTDYIISVQGKIDLSIFDSQKSEDDRAGLQVDLSGEKYIKITTPHDFKSAKFDIVGDLTYQNLTLADGFFLKEGVISVDTENDKWEGTADIEFTYFDKALKAEYVVVKKQVDTLTLELSGLDIAVGATGFFLESINGGVRNFSDGDDKPSEIVAGVGLYYGKQISIGGSTYSLATIDADVTITNKNITGSGDIEVLGGLVSGNVSLTVDWKDASLTANGKVTLAKLLTSQGALKIDLNGNVAFATAGVIDFSEFGLGFTMSSNVLLQFSNDNNNTNDYYAAWCTQEFCGTKQSLGVRFTLDGSWELLGTEKVKKINENDNPITYSLRRSRSIPPVTGSWDLSGVSGIVLLSAQWESGETEFLLTDGNGNTYTKEDIAKRSDMEIVESMSNDKTLVIAVKDPVEGIWSLSIANGTNVEIDANILNGKSSVAAPTLTAEAGNGRDITVTWHCPELPENAELCIYYDTDSSGNDGVLLAQIVPDENSGTYTWTVPDALAGELRFYAVLSSPDLLPAVGTYTSAIAMEAKEQLVEVDSSGWTYVAGGFYVQDAGITAGGVLEIDGGSLRGDTSVAEDSEIILDEATVSGTLSLAGFMSVKSKIDAADTEIIFDLTNRSLEDDYMIDDISLLSGTPTYTITVAADQIKGTYKLALGASSFEGTISIKDNTTYYGTLSLTQGVTYNGNHYSLLQNGDALELIITDPSDLNVNSLTVNAEETAEQTFTVTVAFSITNLGYEAAESVVYIYDGETKLGEVNVSALADGATFNGTYTIAAGILSAGTHTITVVADGSDIIAEGDENNNSMSTYVTLVQGEVKDFAEPNDSLATAYDLGTVRDSVLLEDLSIHTGDKDYFKFTIAAEDQYTFTTMGTAGDTVLYLYDAEGCLLMSDDDSGDGYFSNITTPLSAGTYYLKVNCYTEIYTIENYSLSCSVTGVAPGISNLTYQDGTCSWSNSDHAAGNVIEFSKDNFETAAQIILYDTAIDLYGLPSGTWQWQVGLSDGEERQIGTEIVSTEESSTPLHFDASADFSNFDLFFGTADGVWEKNYAVQHHGAWDGGIKSWAGTGEIVSIAGKNKIIDSFTGNDYCYNTLLLSDSANGDVLVLDDIFSPTAVDEQNARFSWIDEIRAGGGDDVIDMTSLRFSYYSFNTTVYGGDGNDTIWASNNENTLFGDAGNDRLVGGADNDVIVGGTGNDSMHGGGGEDIFCFGENWGNDTVEQLADGEITLWFESGSESNWDASALTYTDGTNSVKVSGVSAGNITLIFGDDGSTLYDELSAAGCFDDAASEKIFEDQNHGMLA